MLPIHCGLYERQGAEDEEGNCAKMQDFVTRMQQLETEVARDYGLPLPADN